MCTEFRKKAVKSPFIVGGLLADSCMQFFIMVTKKIALAREK